jgi:hypothetical protein
VLGQRPVAAGSTPQHPQHCAAQDGRAADFEEVLCGGRPSVNPPIRWRWFGAGAGPRVGATAIERNQPGGGLAAAVQLDVKILRPAHQTRARCVSPV